MKSNAENSRLQPNDAASVKLKYQTPKLEAYGGLGEIVRTVATSGNMDGGTAAKSKTH